MKDCCSFLFFVLLVCVGKLVCQVNPVPASDPQALVLAAQSLAALSKGATLNDAVLTATASWFAGSDNETGSLVFKTRNTDDSRIDLSLNKGVRSLVRNGLPGTPQGAWVGTGFARSLAQHNCWTDANWFFPHFSMMTNLRVQNVFTYVGREVRNGLTVEHLQSYRYIGTNPTIVSTIPRLSTVDYFLDATTFLPLAMVFKQHPDNDMNLDARIEIRYAAYQTFAGILVPTRVQTLINDGLLLDVSITNATFNNGLQDTDFQFQ